MNARDLIEKYRAHRWCRPIRSPAHHALDRLLYLHLERQTRSLWMPDEDEKEFQALYPAVLELLEIGVALKQTEYLEPD